MLKTNTTDVQDTADIVSALKSQEQATYDEYVALVQSHLDGTTIDVVSLGVLMQTLRKDSEDFTRDACLLDAYNKWYAYYEQIPPLLNRKNKASEAKVKLLRQYEKQAMSPQYDALTSQGRKAKETLDKEVSAKLKEQDAIIAVFEDWNSRTNRYSVSTDDLWKRLRITGGRKIGEPKETPQPLKEEEYNPPKKTHIFVSAGTYS